MFKLWWKSQLMTNQPKQPQVRLPHRSTKSFPYPQDYMASDFNPKHSGWGVQMMLSLFEVLHQPPAPQGEKDGGVGYHTDCGRPAGLQRRRGATRPACKKSLRSARLCSQQLSPFALMNGSHCYTLCHAGLQHRDTWQQTLSNGFLQRPCNIWKIYYLI